MNNNTTQSSSCQDDRMSITLIGPHASLNGRSKMGGSGAVGLALDLVSGPVCRCVILVVGSEILSAVTLHQRLIDDRLWELIQPPLPPRPRLRGPGGRPRIDDRVALEGILFVLRAGCRWRDLPPELGFGSGHTAWRQLWAWQDAGVWDRLHRVVLEKLSEAAPAGLFARLHRRGVGVGERRAS